MPVKKRPRPLPKRSKPPVEKPRPARAALKVPTEKERYAKGARDHCDICKVKMGGPKKVEIWTFTVEGAKGKLFNRCRRHLGRRPKLR